MKISCLDMKGILICELWPHIVKLSGIDEPVITIAVGDALNDWPMLPRACCSSPRPRR